MKSREEEIREFLSIIQPHITAFSTQLLLNYKNEDEVVVGGEVVSLFDSNRLDMKFDEPYGESAELVNDMGVYITINDSIGEIILVIFQTTYLEILRQLGESLIGKTIIASGQYAELDKSMQFITEAGKLIKIDSHPFKETIPRVFCHKIEVLKTED